MYIGDGNMIYLLRVERLVEIILLNILGYIEEYVGVCRYLF